MLGEIIRELTKVKVNNTINSETVLAWAKRVEMQRVQAAVLNTLTESRQFDKIKVSKRAKEDTTRPMVGWMLQWQPCQYCGKVHPLR